jgi:hypothetical protein
VTDRLGQAADRGDEHGPSEVERDLRHGRVT